MSRSNSKKKISKKKIRNYLESLTKEKLIDLILKLAPQSFFDSINIQLASQDEAMVILKEASKAINTILSDENLLYNPSEFERELLKQLEKIRGLWDKFPSEIGDLIVKIIEDVDREQDDGYLYIDNYQRQEYFESEDIDDYIFSFVVNLPLDIKSDYTEKLKKTLKNCIYSNFPSLEKKLSGL